MEVLSVIMMANNVTSQDLILTMMTETVITVTIPAPVSTLVTVTHLSN